MTKERLIEILKQAIPIIASEVSFSTGEWGGRIITTRALDEIPEELADAILAEQRKNLDEILDGLKISGITFTSHERTFNSALEAVREKVHGR